MKPRWIIAVTLVAGICRLTYAAGKKKEPKVEFEFPAAMAAPVQAEFRKQCEKGMILYNINCAGCHNTLVGGKPLIPDFTDSQLVGYELRVLNPKHETAIPETTISAEELGYVMTFFMYKKKNGGKR